MKLCHGWLVALALGAATAGCAVPPRPPALAQAEGAARSPASLQAAKLVPQAYARAEQLRNEADQAWRNDQRAAAAILAERALVAYEHAAVLAELVRAAKVAESARQQLQTSEQELRTLDAEQARLVAETEALEARVKSLKDAEPPAPAGKADPEREAARLAASHSMAVDARLLCASARLLDPKAEGLEQAEAQVQALERALAAAPKTAPIDDARRARARCLSVLTSVRRAAAAPASGVSDVVLAELSSKTTLGPVRDDRGVVVSVPADAVTKPGDAGKALIAPIGAIAAAHPEFPLLLVTYPRGADAIRAKANAEALSKALVSAGVKPERIHIEQASAAQPVGGKNRPQGERIDVVFVSPGS